MNQVHVKIHEWVESDNSLIVSFASDTTSSSNPEDYGKIALQPHLMWPDISDSTELMKRLAQVGVTTCEEIVKNETLANDADAKSLYSSLVGPSQTFNVADVI